MTRRPHQPRHWQSRVWTTTHADTMARLAGKCPYCGGADGEHGQIRDHGGGWMPCPLGEFTPRAKPVQHEQGERGRLIKALSTRWYRHGVSMPETRAQRGGQESAGLGPYASGWPDVVVQVPGWQCEYPLPPIWHGPIEVALELKQPNIPHKGAVGEWWLEWARQDWDEWTLAYAHVKPKKFGLTLGQARKLASLDRCGWRTMVAYSADEAIAWLDEQIGPRPAGRVEWM